MYPKYPRDLTVNHLKRLFSYNAEIGGLIRKSNGKRYKAGRSGYVVITIDGVVYPEHHLVWLWFTGSFPPTHTTLDHKDKIKSHNTFDNLRIATQSQNQANTKVRSDNSLGLRGVYFHKTEKKYRAGAWKNGKFHSCGQFRTVEEANEAAVKKRKELFGEFAS